MIMENLSLNLHLVRKQGNNQFMIIDNNACMEMFANSEISYKNYDQISFSKISINDLLKKNLTSFTVLCDSTVYSFTTCKANLII